MGKDQVSLKHNDHFQPAVKCVLGKSGILG